MRESCTVGGVLPDRVLMALTRVRACGPANRGPGRLIKGWLPSLAWVTAVGASPRAALSPAVSAGDPTVIPLCAMFVLVGVLGIPLGFGLGRWGDARRAVVTAGTAIVTATVCTFCSTGTGVTPTPGGAAIVLVLAFLFALLALPLPGIGFVIGWVLKQRRRPGAARPR